MRTMAAGVFKAQCLKLMDEVHDRREPVLITKNGKPVAKLVPADGPRRRVFGCAAGTARIVGEILTPTVEAEDWESVR